MSASIDEHYVSLLARRRRQRDHPCDLLGGREGVVLMGAGKTGGEFLVALRAAGIPVFAFADNNRARWGATVDGVSVMPPADAVRAFGSRAVHVVTIGRVGAGAGEIVEQLSALGADRVLHFIQAVALLPEIWRQFFLDPDAFRGEDAEHCAAAYGVFKDEISRQHFRAHLAWRAALDSSSLAIPSYDDQYFPAGVIAQANCRRFVDIGAYTGDTLAALAEFAGPSLLAYYGFEPDARSYERLVSEAAALRKFRPDVRVSTAQTAVGNSTGMISFSDEGSATSQIASHGSHQVPCARLDDLGVGAPTYVKIDVEGAEAQVLDGAETTLSASKPTIACAVYHRPRDLFELPLRLAGYADDYRFYLRSHGDAGIDLVCYAVR